MPELPDIVVYLECLQRRVAGRTPHKVLADRSLSRLLKGDWPRSVEEWEAGQEPT